MMKKNGFTLAEVLITLAIIGVVATMTLPALMTNTGEQQAKTGLKKGINTLTEAAQMNQALEGWDFASATEANTTITTDNDFTSQNFDSLIGNRTNVDYSLGTKVPQKIGSADLKSLTAVYFKDGTAIYYDPKKVVADSTNAKKQKDNLSLGYVVYFDTNGVSGPNIISNCAGNPLGTTSEVSTVTTGFTPVTPATATTKCKVKTDRVIKDVFPIRLREAQAFPEGYAATWAINGDVKKAAGAS